MKFRDVRIDWRIPATLGVAALLAALTGQSGIGWFRFDRTLLAEGQLWRLVTGQLVHLGWQHMILNLAGLLLVWLLVGEQLSLRRWLIVLLASLAGVAGGLWFLNADLEWYVGMSGLLHGLLIAGLIPGIRQGSVEAVIVAMALVLKLAYEQFAGPLPGSAAAAGGAVVVDAHLYGFIAGALAALSFGRRVLPTASI